MFTTNFYETDVTFESFLAGFGMVHIALPKQPIDQFNPVIYNRKQELRASFPNMYTGFKKPDTVMAAWWAKHCGLTFEMA